MHLKKKNNIYFQRNGSEFSTRILNQPKEFWSENNSPFVKSGKKSIDICLLFFLRGLEYDYERVEQSVFCTKNSSRAPVGLFLAEAPIYIADSVKSQNTGVFKVANHDRAIRRTKLKMAVKSSREA